MTGGVTRWARAAAREIAGLFVEDGWLAGFVLAWILACFGLARLGAFGWGAVVLPGGLGLILIESTLRR